MGVKMGREATRRSFVSALRCPAEIVISSTVPSRTGGAIDSSIKSEEISGVMSAAFMGGGVFGAGTSFRWVVRDSNPRPRH